MVIKGVDTYPYPLTPRTVSTPTTNYYIDPVVYTPCRPLLHICLHRYFQNRLLRASYPYGKEPLWILLFLSIGDEVEIRGIASPQQTIKQEDRHALPQTTTPYKHIWRPLKKHNTTPAAGIDRRNVDYSSNGAGNLGLCVRDGVLPLVF